jgi:hypothetical protein
MSIECSRRQFIELSGKFVGALVLAAAIDSPAPESRAEVAGLPLGEMKLNLGEVSVRFDSACHLAEETARRYQSLAPLPELNLTAPEQADYWLGFWRDLFWEKGFALPAEIPLVESFNKKFLTASTWQCRPPLKLRFPGSESGRQTVELLPSILAHELAHLWQRDLCARMESESIESGAELMSWSLQAQALGSDLPADIKLWLERSFWKNLLLRATDLVGLAWLRDGQEPEKLRDWARRTSLADEAWLAQMLAFRDYLDKYSLETAGTEFEQSTKRWRRDQINQADAAIYAERPWFKLIYHWQRGDAIVQGSVPGKRIDLNDLFNLIG